MKKRKLIIFAVVLSALVLIATPLVVNLLYRKPAATNLFDADWEAADALAYAGGALACIGTMTLGYISWQQTKELQKIERNSFIAANSCMALLSKLKFKNLRQQEVNLELHEEPIVWENTISGDSYGSCKIIVSLNRMDKFAAMVRVNSLLLICGDSAPIFATAYDKCFSRIAISKDIDRFEITVLLTPESKSALVDALQGRCEVDLDMSLELVSPSLVSTKIKCRGHFPTSQTSITEFSVNDDNPMCFYYGNEILDANDIRFRYQEKDDATSSKKRR